MKFARTDKSRLAEWWQTVDRVLLGALVALAASGVLVSLAASPAAAVKRGLAPFHLVERHVIYALAALAVMLAVSTLEHRRIRRLAVAMLTLSVLAMAAVLFIGPEVNGSRRWLRIAGLSVQPSEFMKPAFAVLAAWLLADSRRRADMPALPLAFALYVLIAALLIAEPDVGQTALLTLVFGALYLLSGQPLIAIGALGAAAVAGAGALYAAFPHVQSRFGRFLGQGGGDSFQTDRAIQSFAEGGLFGRGPGEGIIKIVLPDAHTDFIFAVIGEEFGALACLALLALIAFVVGRAMVRAIDEPELSVSLAISGLALFLAFQALINMGVNVGLLPAKGMTLPFISNGGSSMLATGAAMGMLLALTRQRPGARARRRQQFAPAAALQTEGPTRP